MKQGSIGWALKNIIARGLGGYKSATSQGDTENGLPTIYKKGYYFPYGPKERYGQRRQAPYNHTTQYLSMRGLNGRDERHRT